jgi:hypothetical protein
MRVSRGRALCPGERQEVSEQLDEVGLRERQDDGVEVELEEREQGVVGDVSRAPNSNAARRSSRSKSG